MQYCVALTGNELWLAYGKCYGCGISVWWKLDVLRVWGWNSENLGFEVNLEWMLSCSVLKVNCVFMRVLDFFGLDSYLKFNCRAPGCQREYESRAAVNTVVLHPNQVSCGVSLLACRKDKLLESERDFGIVGWF